MKKIILSITAIVIMSFGANAQVEDHALGVRLGGGNFGSGFEASYQHKLSDVNRIEADFGLNSKSGISFVSIAGIYHWVWSLDDVHPGFNWYAGPGAQLLLISDNTSFGIGGEIGVEYNLNTEADVPLLVSLDTRPMINLGDGDGFIWAIALSIRYTF